MERSAPLATALKLSPSRSSSRVAASSIYCRSVSSRHRSRAVKSFGVEVVLIQLSLQPPPLSGVGIAGGQIVLALARHVEADFLQGGDHVGAALYRAVLDALHQIVADQFARVGLLFEPGPQLRCLDVGPVARLLRPGPRRVVRTAPAVLVVEGVAQRVEGPLPAGRRDVQAPARLEVALGGKDVRVDAAAALAVQNRRPRVAVRLQSRPRRPLELVKDGFDLLAGRPVLGCPRDHDRRVLALELQRVGHGGRLVRIGPAGKLVQVVADARDLAGALALGGAGGRGPRPRPRLPQQRGGGDTRRRRLRPPGGTLRGRDPGGDPARPLLQQRRDRQGVRRGARPPLPGRSVQHCVGWLTVSRSGRRQPCGADRPGRRSERCERGSVWPFATTPSPQCGRPGVYFNRVPSVRFMVSRVSRR